jgi:GNAT superfamily N-acetyltransferase
MTDTPAFALRQMRPEDAASVAELSTELGYPATASDIARRYRFLKNCHDGTDSDDRQSSQLLVAELFDGRPAGWIHVEKTYLLECEPRAEIRGLIVSEDMRGKGIGRCACVLRAPRIRSDQNPEHVPQALALIVGSRLLSALVLCFEPEQSPRAACGYIR